VPHPPFFSGTNEDALDLRSESRGSTASSALEEAAYRDSATSRARAIEVIKLPEASGRREH